MSRDFWNKTVRPKIYIFCEWSTEKFYFTKLKTIFRNSPFEIKPINLKTWWAVKDIRKLNSKIKAILNKDKISWIKLVQIAFVVFDVDIFTEIEINTLYSNIDNM